MIEHFTAEIAAQRIAEIDLQCGSHNEAWHRHVTGAVQDAIDEAIDDKQARIEKLEAALVPFKEWLIDGTLQLESDERSVDRGPIHLHLTVCEGSCDYGCADSLETIIQRIRDALAPVEKKETKQRPSHNYVDASDLHNADLPW